MAEPAQLAIPPVLLQQPHNRRVAILTRDVKRQQGRHLLGDDALYSSERVLHAALEVDAARVKEAHHVAMPRPTGQQEH